jgi:multiple sugar transport system permease protein
MEDENALGAADETGAVATMPRQGRSNIPPSRRMSRRFGRALMPLVWLGPAIALIAVIVIWPVVSMFQTSTLKVDNTYGIITGHNGLKNFSTLFKEPDLVSVMTRTAVWVIGVVAITIVLSLGLAQLFNQRFPGRRVARWALIAPWAASVLMTSLIFRWALDPNNGVVNVFLHDVGALKSYNSAQASWLGRPDAALMWMMFVAIFVSLPFTTYAILAGLQTIPADVYEAARVDGSSKWRSYRSITLPLLRPALTVAALINIMNVFNSFPIIWSMTQGGPGSQTATSTIYMYQLEGSNIGESAAMSVVNFGFVVIIVVLFLWASRWNKEVD